MYPVNKIAEGVFPIPKQEALLKQLLEQYPEKKITCADARAWAEKYAISYEQMGELLDEAKVKVKQCALGCF